MPDEPNPAAEFRYAAVVYQIVTEMVTPVILGWFIDWAAGTMPGFIIAGVFLGLGLGVVRVLRLTKPRDGPPAGRDRGGP
jgi:F0F1-type ATP synthase assembly protein I